MIPSAAAAAVGVGLLAAATLLLTLSVWPIALSGRRTGPGLWLLGPWIVLVAASGLQLLEYVELGRRLGTSPLSSRWQDGIAGVSGATQVALTGWVASGMLLLVGGVLSMIAARIVGTRGEAPEHRPLLQTIGALQVTLGVFALSVGGIQGSRVATLNLMQWDPFDTSSGAAEVVGVLGGSFPCCGAPLFVLFGIVTALSATRNRTPDDLRSFAVVGLMAVPLMGMYGTAEWMLRDRLDQSRGPEDRIEERMVELGFDLPTISWGAHAQAFPELSLWPDGTLLLNGVQDLEASGIGAALDQELGPDTGQVRQWTQVNLRIHGPTRWSRVQPLMTTLQSEGVRSIGLVALDGSGRTTYIMAAIDPTPSKLTRFDVHRGSWTYMGSELKSLDDFYEYSNVLPPSHDVLDVHVDADATWHDVVQGIGRLQQQTWFSEVRLVVGP